MSDWKKKLDEGEGKRLDRVLTKEEDSRLSRLPKILSKTSPEDLTVSTTGSAGVIESTEYLDARIESIKRFIPYVDFSKPENFAKFGSAKQYYEDSIRRIYETFPYDGSAFEKEQWVLSSSYIDLYMYESEYPRTTGYVNFSPSGWGSLSGIKNAGYGLSDAPEYIYFEGGPNKDNVYDPNKNRISNLRIDGKSGNTVEFWLKKSDFVASGKTDKEVVFDAWTLDYISGSTDAETHGNSHARLKIELDSSVSSGSPWRITYLSGSNNGLNDQIVGDMTKSAVADGKWHHYTFSLQHSGSKLGCSMYVDGKFNDHRSVSVGSFGSVDTNIVATIGALGTKKSATGTATLGWGKLSGSIDDFRFWKKSRNAQEVGLHWFTTVHGGTNTFLKNDADLGVYYKFNEGVSLSSSVDSKVLDYSGRVTNGLFKGYSENSRTIGSAIDESGNGTEEKDPIVYWFHPDVLELINKKKEEGEYYDYNNNASIFNSIPDWIVTEDVKKDRSLVRELTQVVSSYFDTLYLQAEALPKLKNVEYRDFFNKNHVSGSKPLPFSNKLLESYSFVTPELFADASVMELISNRDEKRDFEEEISDVKNFIYKNIYNNIVNIYKTKGTEKSFRNFIRCFGVGDDVIRLNTYANNYTYSIKDNLRYTTSRKNVVNFYNTSSFEASIYQTTSSTGQSKNYIPGVANADSLSSTFEVDVFVPKHAEENSRHFFDVSFVTASVFGCHTPAQLNSSDASWASSDNANFSVDVIRPVKNEAYFRLKSSNARIPTLTSSVFPIFESDRRWGLSVRIGHSSREFGNLVSGAADSPYDVVFSGFSYLSDEIEDEFTVSGSMTVAHGNAFHQTNKRLYAGAHRNNFTGSLINRTDVKIGSVRYWQDFLSDEEVKNHAMNPDSYGRSSPQKSSVLFEKDYSKTEIPSIATLALHWDFSNLTSSNEGGNLDIADITSGSYTSRYGALNSVLTSYYPAIATGFLPSDQDAISVKVEAVAKPHKLENVYSSDMVQILDEDPEVFTRNSRPTNFYFMFEKSMYQAISEEMIGFFSTITDFNNLIGEPVNKYRQKYKALENLRALFFERVQNTPDIDKYIEYYKWIDLSMSKMIDQLKPIAFDFSEDINTMIESHILERSKYWTKYPTLEMNSNEPLPPILGINELLYDWEHGHAPVDKNREDQNCLWWKDRAGRDDSNIMLSGAAGAASADREKIRRVQNSEVSGSTYVLRKLAKPYRFSVDRQQTINSGHNARANKNRQFYKGALTISEEATMTLLSSSIEEVTDCDDVFGSNQKETIRGKVDTEGTAGYMDADAVMSLPFSLFSSSVGTGYISGSGLSGVKPGLSISNLHDDSYGVDALTPLQSGFTSTHVGGMPHRHTPFRRQFSTSTTTQTIYGTHSQEGLKFAGTNSSQEYMHTNGLMNYAGTSATSGIKNSDMSFFVWVKIPSVSTFSAADSTYPSSDADVSDADRHRWHSIFSITSPLDGTASDRTRLNNLRSAMFFGVAGHPSLEKNDGSTITGGNLVLDASSETSYHDWVDTGTKLDDDEWHHVGFTYDLSEDTFKIYVDNILVATKDYGNTGSDRWNASSDAQQAVYAAAYYVDSNSSTALIDNFLHATFSNMTIWTQLLDASQVSELYNSGVPGDANAHSLASSSSKLRVWYKLDSTNNKEDISEHTGTSWGDRDGTLTGIESSNYVAISQGQTTTVEAGTDNRPEAYQIIVQQKTPSADGKIQVKSVDTGTPASAFYRDGLAKRPVNIANIQHTTASVVLGNYNNSYEIIQTMGKTSNPGEFIKEGGYSLTPNLNAASNTLNMVDTEVRFTGSSDNRHIFASRFSALGGPSSKNEVNLESGEYSPYNTLNYRNIKARQLLDILHSEYSDRFGARSGSVIVSGAGTGADYELSSSVIHVPEGHHSRPTVAASVHKTHRNTRYVMTQTGSVDINGYEINHDGKPQIQRDTFFVQHPIPQSALQYSWIGDSTLETTGSFLGYQHDYTIAQADGTSEYQREISFVSSSQHMPTEIDFVGLNRVVVSPITSSEGILGSGFASSLHSGSEALNNLILNRQGPYGWPSWKQLRGSEHAIVRHNNKSNIFSVHLRGEALNSSPMQLMPFYSDSSRGYASAGDQPRRELVNASTFSADREVTTFVESPITTGFRSVKFGFGAPNESYIEMLNVPAGAFNTARFAKLFNPHWNAGRQTTIEVSYANSICHFSNEELEYYFQRAGLIGPTDYRNSKIYEVLDVVAADRESAPDMASYNEVVYPRRKNSHTSISRTRSNFINNFWRDQRSDRQLILTGAVDYTSFKNDIEAEVFLQHPNVIPQSYAQSQKHINSMGFDVVDDTYHNKIHITQSMWPLDGFSGPYELDPVRFGQTGWRSYGGLYSPYELSMDAVSDASSVWDRQAVARTPSGLPTNAGAHLPTHVGMSYTAMYAIHADMHPVDTNRFDGPTPGYTSFIGDSIYPNGLNHQGRNGEGELQNDYSIFHLGHNSVNLTPTPALVYNRRVPQAPYYYPLNRIQGSPSAAPNMVNPELGGTRDISNSWAVMQVLAGDAKWLAGEQAGKYPFYKSYDEYREEFRAISQDYSLLPEFKISDHMSNIIKLSSSIFTRPRNSIEDEPIKDILSLTGGVHYNNLESGFYEVYSTSDMMKYFDFISNQVGGSTMGLPPSRLTMKCEAITKLLPYDGFYPVLRTMELGRIFTDDYLSSGFGLDDRDGHSKDVAALFNKKITGSLSQIIKPFMAPGVLFNSIKSGLAVDYPVFNNAGSGSMEVATRDVDDSLELLLMGISGSLTAGTHWKTYGENHRKARAIVDLNRYSPASLAGATLTLTHPVSGSKVFTIGSDGSSNSGLTVGLDAGDSSETARNLVSAITDAGNYSGWTTEARYHAELHSKNSASVLIRSGPEAPADGAERTGIGNTISLSSNSSWSLRESFNTPWFDMPAGGSNYGSGVTGSFFNGTVDSSMPRISSSVDHRVSFESFLFPESLKGRRFWDNEPHPSASMLLGGYEQWRVLDYPPIFGEINPESKRKLGLSATKYQDMTAFSLAANNFVAETTNLFMEDGKLTSIMSDPDSRWSAPNDIEYGADAKEFRMRFYLVNNNVMMYDRHSAFGPPVDGGVITRDTSVERPGQQAVSRMNVRGTPTGNYHLASGADQFIAITSSDGIVHKVAFTTNETSSVSGGYGSSDDLTTAGTAEDPYMYYLQVGTSDVPVNSTGYADKNNFATILSEKLQKAGICIASNLQSVQAGGGGDNDRRSRQSFFYMGQYQTGSSGNTQVTVPDLLMTGSSPSIPVFTEKTYQYYGGPHGYRFEFGEDRKDISITENKNKRHNFEPYVPGFLDKASVADASKLTEDEVISAPYVEFCLRATKTSYTLDELFANLEITSSTPMIATGSTGYDHAMSLSASFNFLASVVEPVVQRGADGTITTSAQPTNVEANKRWVIYPKWETPVLDFQDTYQKLIIPAVRHFTEDLYHPVSGNIPYDTFLFSYGDRNGRIDGTYMGLPGAQAVTSSKAVYNGSRPFDQHLTSSKGMWHQYGKYPSKGQGYFGLIKDVKGYPSLADMVGFKKDQQVQYGRVKEQAKISEAVVAIPFYIEDETSNSTIDAMSKDGEFMRFFELADSTTDLVNRLEVDPASVGQDAKHQINMMKKFIFPPQYDFLTHTDKPPIVMFVFPFSATLSRQDLVDMWQNLPPKAALHASSPSARYVSHDLSLPESIKLEKDVYWKVFKVKQRASHLYSDKIKDSLIAGSAPFSESMLASSEQTELVSAIGSIDNFVKTNGVSYNWPYDFFSLVELVKLENKVDFESTIAETETETIDPQPEGLAMIQGHSQGMTGRGAFVTSETTTTAAIATGYIGDDTGRD